LGANSHSAVLDFVDLEAPVAVDGSGSFGLWQVFGRKQCGRTGGR
jgi:hypothetical protein